MKEQLLLKSQQNDVFLAIQRLGLSPAEFSWTRLRSRLEPGVLMVSVLVHNPTKFSYMFDITNKGHYSFFSPGASLPEETAFPGGWDQCMLHVERWLMNLRREISAPDLWGAVAQTDLLQSAGKATDNSAFSAVELQRISDGVGEIKEFLKTTGLADSPRWAQIEGQLNYLIDASRRMGRKDWINTTVGVLGLIVGAAALPPEVARTVFQLAGTVFHWITTGQPLLL